MRNHVGVTAPPLWRQGEERLARDERAMRVEAIPFLFDALLLKYFSLACDPHAAHVQHGLRSLEAPMHAGGKVLTGFYSFPKEHWKHLRTPDVVESPAD